MQASQQNEFRFASFILGDSPPIELAIDAHRVLEATPIAGSILPLPASADCIEGIMQLRDDTIPVINMKKRLGLPVTGYGPDAKVAVVQLLSFRCGLIFDDIRDVLQIAPNALQPLHPALTSEDRVISKLIKLSDEVRTLEVLDLDLIFPAGVLETEEAWSADGKLAPSEPAQSYSRYVVFDSGAQQYGVRVEQAQEITFLSKIDDLFQKDAIEGALDLRGSTIPVLNAARLLLKSEAPIRQDEHTRILVLTSNQIQYGLIVDAVREIVSVADDTILPLPAGGHQAVEGIVQCSASDDIMLVNVDALIQTQHEELRAMARFEDEEVQRRQGTHLQSTRHLITADCYLIFALDKNYAIVLNDVQEIIEAKDLMSLPDTDGTGKKVLNLRGKVIPVINLSHFLNEPIETVDQKLIIGRKADQMVALQVGRIVTIHKQVKFQNTPSLNPRYHHCADMLDRLIDFVGESGLREHVLVVNIEKLMRNHLGMLEGEVAAADEIQSTPLMGAKE